MTCKKVSPVFSLINGCLGSIFLLLLATPGCTGKWKLSKLQEGPWPAVTITTTDAATTTPTNTTTTPTLVSEGPLNFSWDACLVGNNQEAIALCNGSTNATSCYQGVCLAIRILNVINEVVEIKAQITELWRLETADVVEESYPGSILLVAYLMLVFGFLIFLQAAFKCGEIQVVTSKNPAPIVPTYESPV